MQGERGEIDGGGPAHQRAYFCAVCFAKGGIADLQTGAVLFCQQYAFFQKIGGGDDIVNRVEGSVGLVVVDKFVHGFSFAAGWGLGFRLPFVA